MKPPETATCKTANELFPAGLITSATIHDIDELSERISAC